MQSYTTEPHVQQQPATPATKKSNTTAASGCAIPGCYPPSPPPESTALAMSSDTISAPIFEFTFRSTPMPSAFPISPPYSDRPAAADTFTPETRKRKAYGTGGVGEAIDLTPRKIKKACLGRGVATPRDLVVDTPHSPSRHPAQRPVPPNLKGKKERSALQKPSGVKKNVKVFGNTKNLKRIMETCPCCSEASVQSTMPPQSMHGPSRSGGECLPPLSNEVSTSDGEIEVKDSEASYTSSPSSQVSQPVTGVQTEYSESVEEYVLSWLAEESSTSVSVADTSDGSPERPMSPWSPPPFDDEGDTEEDEDFKDNQNNSLVVVDSDIEVREARFCGHWIHPAFPDYSEASCPCCQLRTILCDLMNISRVFEEVTGGWAQWKRSALNAQDKAEFQGAKRQYVLAKIKLANWVNQSKNQFEKEIIWNEAHLSLGKSVKNMLARGSVESALKELDEAENTGLLGQVVISAQCCANDRALKCQNDPDTWDSKYGGNCDVEEELFSSAPKGPERNRRTVGHVKFHDEVFIREEADIDVLRKSSYKVPHKDTRAPRSILRTAPDCEGPSTNVYKHAYILSAGVYTEPIVAKSTRGRDGAGFARGYHNRQEVSEGKINVDTSFYHVPRKTVHEEEEVVDATWQAIDAFRKFLQDEADEWDRLDADDEVKIQSGLYDDQSIKLRQAETKRLYRLNAIAQGRQMSPKVEIAFISKPPPDNLNPLVTISDGCQVREARNCQHKIHPALQDYSYDLCPHCQLEYIIELLKGSYGEFDDRPGWGARGQPCSNLPESRAFKKITRYHKSIQNMLWQWLDLCETWCEDERDWNSSHQDIADSVKGVWEGFSANKTMQEFEAMDKGRDVWLTQDENQANAYGLAEFYKDKSGPEPESPPDTADKPKRNRRAVGSVRFTADAYIRTEADVDKLRSADSFRVAPHRSGVKPRSIFRAAPEPEGPSGTPVSCPSSDCWMMRNCVVTKPITEEPELTVKRLRTRRQARKAKLPRSQWVVKEPLGQVNTSFYHKPVLDQFSDDRIADAMEEERKRLVKQSQDEGDAYDSRREGTDEISSV